ncbi:MAG: HIT family protein, partial [Mammaliicoccus vitulinus]
IPRYKEDIDGFGYIWNTNEDRIDDDKKAEIAKTIQKQF